MKPVSEPKRFLLVKFSALGDTLLMMPALRKIRQVYPDAKLSMVVTPVNLAAAKGCSQIDELLVFEPGWIKHPLALGRFLIRLRRLNADVALDFDQWLRISALFTLISGAPVRVGFRTKNQHRHFAYTNVVDRSAEKHEVEHFLSIISSIGIMPREQDKKLFFEIGEEDARAGKVNIEQMGLRKPFVVIHPGCGAHGWQRQWPEDRYAEVVRFLDRQGFGIAITAGRDELQIYRTIRELSGVDIKLIKTSSLSELAQIISESSVFLSGNTGIMHLAACVGARVVALHGPTNAKKWGPYGPDCTVIAPRATSCSPCLDLGFEYGCKARACMEDISVERVIQQLQSLGVERSTHENRASFNLDHGALVDRDLQSEMSG